MNGSLFNKSLNRSHAPKSHFECGYRNSWLLKFDYATVKYSFHKLEFPTINTCNKSFKTNHL